MVVPRSWQNPGPMLLANDKVSVAVGGTFEGVWGWPDLRFGRLQDRVVDRSRPRREGLAQVAVIGILGWDLQALPVRELAGEGAVLGGEVFDPLAHLRGRLLDGPGELVALSRSGGVRGRGARLAGGGGRRW